MARLTMAGATKKVAAGAVTPTPPAADKPPVVENTAAQVNEVLETPARVAETAPPAVPVHVSIDALIEALSSGSDRAETAGLRVVGPRKGRRRVGRAFGPEAVVIPLINLGEDELRSIDGDPELSWSVVPLAPADEEEGD
ncbi:hypothetical protein HHL26_04630 [Sphingobium sp. TB-6]|uniref:hypothetical protein n=1 Tax=Sphingobium sp. TB-6 TaxID=2728850 RepID=UPI00146C0413|nr:hypothetical protein [Sphingobium sp. TB-6]NML88351.1 hypothetical protein [Sphingobium sp. TB-6]